MMWYFSGHFVLLKTLCVNKTHCHNEYQYFLAIFQNKGYWCYWVSVIKYCIMHFSLSCCYVLGSVLICFEYFCQDFEKKLLAVYWLYLSHIFFLESFYIFQFQWLRKLDNQGLELVMQWFKYLYFRSYRFFWLKCHVIV
jgi:hypothetical protein